MDNNQDDSLLMFDDIREYSLLNKTDTRLSGLEFKRKNNDQKNPKKNITIQKFKITPNLPESTKNFHRQLKELHSIASGIAIE